MLQREKVFYTRYNLLHIRPCIHVSGWPECSTPSQLHTSPSVSPPVHRTLREHSVASLAFPTPQRGEPLPIWVCQVHCHPLESSESPETTSPLLPATRERYKYDHLRNISRPSLLPPEVGHTSRMEIQREKAWGEDSLVPRLDLSLYLVSLVFSCSVQFCHGDGVEALSIWLPLEFNGFAVFCDSKVAAFLSPNPNVAYQKSTT